MKDIKNYIKLDKSIRQKHLLLDESCIERGGNSSSTNCKALLAHILNTTIPYGNKDKVLLCHACHNSKCSNPNHLYWGTYADNNADRKENGYILNIWDCMVAKYGLEEARRMQGRGNKSAGGKGNKGKLKKEEHKKKISESMKKIWNDRKLR